MKEFLERDFEKRGVNSFVFGAKDFCRDFES
jgi:hypothetical protein